MSINFETASYQYKMRKLGEDDINQIQDFLNLFDDFFLLCEGEKGSAKSLLAVCPPDKDLLTDKIVIGFYAEDVLIGIVDLIKNYPEEGIWTIGYLLIHPAYRNQKIGSYILNMISNTKDIKRLRCVVQAQNPRALSFWENNEFLITSKAKQHLGTLESDIFILEKWLENSAK